MLYRFRRNLTIASIMTMVVAWVAAPAHALDPAPTKWTGGFVGTTLGVSKTDGYSAGSGTVLTKNDDTDFSYIVFGGYQFLTYFGLAGAWVDLGSTSYAGSVPTDGNFTDKLSVKGFNLMPMGFLPIAPRHALFGYLGAYRWSQKVDFNGSLTGPFQTTDHGTSPSAGVGYDWYAIDHNLGVHIQYSRFFRIGSNDNSGHRYDRDFASVGMIWSFR